MKKLLLIAAITFTLSACSKDEETDPNTKYCVECQSKTTLKQTGATDFITNSELKACGWTIALLDSYLAGNNMSSTGTSEGFTVTYKTETTCTKRKE